MREVQGLEDRVGTALTVSELTGGVRPRVDRRYQLVRLLGRGANGVVVEAKDERLDRDVALKLFANWDDRVLREARSIAKLDHPNIIRVHDVGVGELAAEGETALPCAYLSMALVRGKSLREWLATKPPQARIRSVLRSAGEGLAAAHEAGLVHRDVKPDNIMVGADDQALVVDFGLARPAPEQGDLATLAGTPPYMAPEALGGEVSEAADVYAFARVTVEVLTGVLPSSKHGLDATLAGLDASIRKVLCRALDPQPKRRPKVAAIVKALRHRSRHRIAWGLLIVAALAFLVASQASRMSFRGSTVAAAPLAPTAPAPVACTNMAGIWNFRTNVDELGTADHGLGARGQYLLRVTPECSIESFRKTHWRNRGGRWQRQGQVADLIHVQSISTDSLDFECQLRGRYEFTLRFLGPDVSGSFRQIDRLGATHWSGSLSGDRE